MLLLSTLVVGPLLRLVQAAPALPPLTERATSPTVVISNGTVIGALSGDVETFKGIPFAQAPVGSLRLKPPQYINETYGTLVATGVPRSCPQMYFSTSEVPTDVLGLLLDTPLVQTVTVQGEDCLNLNIHRPSGTNSSSSLPVLFWIFGGGFELGGTEMYDGSAIVETSVSLGQPIIFVAVNYRIGGFGFMPGKELAAEGSTNLGLRDQRLALEWVSENIAAFGGDPEKVTIWGESAGAISAFDHTIINGGNNLHPTTGVPLFRGAIMNSGSTTPTVPVDHPKPQAIYDAVVSYAGCTDATDTLTCLRALPYEDFLNAANSVPGLLSYSSVDLSYLPRPDPSSPFYPTSPDDASVLAQAADVPIIVGDLEDEGTIFALFQANLTTTADIVAYLSAYFPQANTSLIQQLVALYPADPAAGSPFRTGVLNELYPVYKRLAALLGDATFTLTRRIYLDALAAAGKTELWSYFAPIAYGTPFLGSFHASDLIPLFVTNTGAFRTAMLTFYFNFVYTGAPGDAWPRWTSEGRDLMEFSSAGVAGTTTDTYREEAYAFMKENTASLRV